MVWKVLWMNVIDMHCDTIAQIYRSEQHHENQRLLSGNLCVDLQKMKKGGYLLQNFAMFTDQSETEDPLCAVLGMIDCYYRELEENKELIAPVFTYEDILENQKHQKMSAMLTLEEGCVVREDLALLRTFYRLGVRMIALTWNFENSIGFPNLMQDGQGKPLFQNRNEKGLTEFGIEMVQEMERLGMIVDVSHLSDGGFWDVLRYTGKPFVASHSNAAKECNVCRNLTDDMVRALADRGGVMGLNYCYDFLTESEQPEDLSTDASLFQDATVHQKKISRIEDMIRHIRHMVNVGGIEVCGLGSDFDGISNSVEFGDASGLPMLYDGLRKAGFSEEDTDRIFYKNVLRVYREVL